MEEIRGVLIRNRMANALLDFSPASKSVFVPPGLALLPMQLWLCMSDVSWVGQDNPALLSQVFLMTNYVM